MVDMHNFTDVERALSAILNQSVSMNKWCQIYLFPKEHSGNTESISVIVVFAYTFQIEPYLPYEFTCEGMLQRVNILIEKQVGRMWLRG